jgi:hypothetical protein|nr:MAG TPA: hypothetical protein [Bacteriophage sp.]
MANNTWSNYTEKTATPVDADEVMARDSTDGKNKRLLFGTFWKWVAKKLNEATISELQTSNKTIIGAINALNSETSKLVALYCIKKSNTSSSGTLTFTYNTLRCSIIMFITQNQKDSSLYYIGINTFNNAIITKLAGANCDISVDISKKTIYVALPDWSSATLLSPDIA